MTDQGSARIKVFVLSKTIIEKWIDKPRPSEFQVTKIPLMFLKYDAVIAWRVPISC